MTTRDDISGWFDRGVAQNALYLIVMCDSFSYEDYPVFAHSDKECRRACNQPGNMQRVMEVYNLAQDKDAQLNEFRANNGPK